MAHSTLFRTGGSGGHAYGRRTTDMGVMVRFLRILLITSLYFKLRNYTEPDDKYLEEVNKKFMIVKRVDALYIPAALTKFLWRRLEVNNLLSDLKNGCCSLNEASSRVYKTVPKFGQYAGILGDIERVLAVNLEQS